MKHPTMPPTTNPELAALNDLLTTMNNPNIHGVEVPTGGPSLQQTMAASPPTPPTSLLTPETAVNVQKLFFTGRLKAGKDHAAQAAGATIFGFADPLYAVASRYFGVEVSGAVGKDLPGMRSFLQIIGQWGRAVVNEAYPLTVPRAIFCEQVRLDGAALLFGFPEVAWDTFGHNPDIWLDACIFRANTFLLTNPTARAAITNCRFDGEFKRLQHEGWQHWHCMLSPTTWAARLAVSKLTPESPTVKDLSEAMATSLDNSVIKQVSASKNGPLLRCIWSDNVIPKPSARLHSLGSFLESIKGAA